MKKFVLVAILFLIGIFLVASAGWTAQCGNTVREGNEECDQGSSNCDNCPNACRTDCVLPRCGDYAVDSGEECDDFTRNSDKIPGACRTNCKKAHCGDGVLDLDQGEECDDANQDAFDGCHQCQKCFEVKDDLTLSNFNGQTVTLCPKDYEFKDKGQEGMIILNSPGMTLDCQGAAIRGASSLAGGVSHSVKAKNLKKEQQQQKNTSSKDSKEKTSLRLKAPEPSTPSGVSSGPNASIKQGVGIIVAADNVVVRNCTLTDLRIGIKVLSKGNVLLDNNVCGNQTDIAATQAENYGAKNYCAAPNSWSEGGKPGCTFSCP